MHAGFGMTAATFLLALLCGGAVAQETSLVALRSNSIEPSSAIQPAPAVNAPMPQAPERHKFWDAKNCVLFSAVAALSTADFAVTRANLQNGGRELNPVTRVFGTSTAGLAFNFAGETAGVVGLSYFFHKTGHHKLERMISLINIGGSATAVSFDLAHR
jgi:hypothetical protein